MYLYFSVLWLICALLGVAGFVIALNKSAGVALYFGIMTTSFFVATLIMFRFHNQDKRAERRRTIERLERELLDDLGRDWPPR